MRQQSKTYAPFADVRYCDFRVMFHVEDADARGGALISTSNGDSGLTTDDLAGWVSNAISGEDGTFAEPPFVYVAFSEPISTIGTTVFFGGAAYPTKIALTAYAPDGASFINRGTFDTSGAIAALSMEAQQYSYLKIEFLEMSEPESAVEISDIMYGLLKIYDKDSIQSATIVNAVGFAGTKLPSQQLTFVVDNSNREHDLLNPKGIYKYLENGQPVEVECIINGEAVFMGTYYFQTASTPNSSMLTTIKASDKITALDGDKFTGGANGNSTLGAMVDVVLAGTDIQTEYEGNLAAAVVAKAIPTTTSKREALRLLAQAACCSCWFSRDNVLHFGALELEYPSHRTFYHDMLFDLGGFTIDEKVDAVKVTAKNSFANTEKVYTYGEGIGVKSISNPCVVDGDKVAQWLYDCYLRRRRYKMKNRGDPALELGDTIMIYYPYNQDFYATITCITLKYNGGFEITTEGIGPGKPVMVFPYYSGELSAGEILNA